MATPREKNPNILDASRFNYFDDEYTTALSSAQTPADLDRAVQEFRVRCRGTEGMAAQLGEELRRACHYLLSVGGNEELVVTVIEQRSNVKRLLRDVVKLAGEGHQSLNSYQERIVQAAVREY